MSSNEDKILHPYFSVVFSDTVRSLMVNPPVTFGHSGSWDTIEFPPGYDKPDKELFNETFSRNLREEGFKFLRTKRNKLLSESDWTDQYEIEEWKKYRQALRDLPSTTEDPENPIWPKSPKVKIIPVERTTYTQLGEELEAEKVKTKNLESRLALLETKIASLNS